MVCLLSLVSAFNGSEKAYRTLKLLERHHEKLAQLIQFQHTCPVTPAPESHFEKTPTSQPPPPKVQDISSYQSQQPPHVTTRTPQRELSSSIASNLASARGIPNNKQRRSAHVLPTLSRQEAEGRFLSAPRRFKTSDSEEKTLRTKRESSYSGAPPQLHTSSPKEVSPTEPDDSSLSAQSSKPIDHFQRFFSNFESLLGRISAPLAFAGLPLTIDDAAPNPTSPSTPIVAASPISTYTAAEPSVSQFISSAALRALRPSNPIPSSKLAESFYVVPVTGGTISYADILARADRNGHHVPILEDCEMDEFVDASETPQPPSPTMQRKGKGVKGRKTMEEVMLENEVMKTLADHLTRRLQEFEMGAQTSTQVLQRSLKASIVAQTSSAEGGESAKIAQLEEELKALRKEMDRRGRENEKLKEVVNGYREKWEKLKEGARGRMVGERRDRDEEAKKFIAG